MAVSEFAKTSHSTGVLFRDNTPTTPVSLTLTNDVSISVSGLTGRALQELLNIQRRGVHFSVGYGAKVYPEAQIEFIMNAWASNGTAPGTPVEFVNFSAPYDANVSTTTVGTRGVKTFDIVIAQEGTDYGDAADDSIIMADCYVSSMTPLSEGEPSTYSMTVVCTGDVTVGGIVFTAA